MTSPRPPRPIDLALGEVAIASILLVGIEAAMLSQTTFAPLWAFELFPVVAVLYLAPGLLAWRRRPSNHLGAVMTAGGLAWVVAGLESTAVPVLVAVGTAAATVPLAVVVHLLLAFPSGRLVDRPSRWAVGAAYFVSVVLQAPGYLFRAPSPGDPLGISNHPGLTRLGVDGQRAAGGAVIAVTVYILLRQLGTYGAAQRRVMRPLFAYGVFAVLWLPFSSDLLGAGFGLDPVAVSTIQLAVLGGVPLAFLLATSRGGFARTGEIEELAAWLSAAEEERPDLNRALATTLGDDSLEVVFAVEGAGYVDGHGRPTALPVPGSTQQVAPVLLAGQTVGAIVYDGQLIADSEPVQAAARVLAMALDRQRLNVELVTSREALRLASARIVVAGDRERRRLAQDLHDGLQGQLVLLAAQAQRSGSPELRSNIDRAADDLRRIVQGVMPSLLLEEGLEAAVEDLADRMPLPTSLRVTLGPAPLGAAVQASAWFVIAESLANAVKHARASQLRVHLSRSQDVLSIQVSDDGIGGARLGAGAGLTGMIDRLQVLGGRVALESTPGRGTTIRAEMPCAS